MLDLVRDCEERLVNVWPAVDTLLRGNWVIRFAHGYSGRANSASAIRAGADLDADDLRDIIGFYRGAGLTPAIRVTPLCADDLGARLQKAGWQHLVTSIGMVAPATPQPHDSAVRIEPKAHPDWLEGVSHRQESATKQNPANLAAIVGRIRVSAGFALLEQDGAPCAFGMTAVDRSMAEIGSILVDEGHRGQGLGRRLVQSLMERARQLGATRLFLQVESNNAVAIALYRSLGFEEVYRYQQYILR